MTGEVETATDNRLRHGSSGVWKRWPGQRQSDEPNLGTASRNIEPSFGAYLMGTMLVFVFLFFTAAAPDIMKYEGDNWVKAKVVQPDPGAAHAAHGGVHTFLTSASPEPYSQSKPGLARSYSKRCPRCGRKRGRGRG